jgi:peptidoglycan/LPS O-acetylase OafA/YrhL
MGEHGRHTTIVEIQHLRALAVLLVVLAHIHQSDARFFSAPLLDRTAYFGFAGVDVFFVLSGFIIHHLYRGHAGFDLRYFLNRLNRILPLYWIFTALALAGYFAIGDSLTRSVGELDLIASLTLIPAHQPPVLMVGWTLTHELYFYAAYGVMLMLPVRYRVWAALAWAVATAAYVAAPIAGGPWLALIFSPFNLLFLGGALIAEFRSSLAGLRWPALVLATGGAVLGLVWTHINGMDALANGVERVGVFAPFAVGAAWAWLAWSPRLPGLAARIGDWSYAIYLSHLLAIGVLARLLPGFVDGAIWSSPLFYAIALAACLMLGALTHTLVEQPLLKLGKAAIRRLVPAAERV